MTTVDLTVAWAGAVNLWDNFSKSVARQLKPFIDDAVDVGNWMRRAWARRSKRAPGAHRSGDSVWEYFQRMSEWEFRICSYQSYRIPGAHRDRRGWRYAPMVWHLLPRLVEMHEHAVQAFRDKLAAQERALAEEEYWESEVARLMREISFMLENPPDNDSIHDCKDCLCGSVERWESMTEVYA